MTIKATLAHGKNFHFYHEGLDNNYVYLELEDVLYDAGYRRIMIAIPIDVWEVIRGLGAAKLDMVNATDEELRFMAENIVNVRIAEYRKAEEISPEKASQLRLSDSVIFGAMDAPREQQVARGVEYYKTERERQREVSIRISQHKILNIETEVTDANNF